MVPYISGKLKADISNTWILKTRVYQKLPTMYKNFHLSASEESDPRGLLKRDPENILDSLTNSILSSQIQSTRVTKNKLFAFLGNRQTITIWFRKSKRHEGRRAWLQRIHREEWKWKQERDITPSSTHPIIFREKYEKSAAERKQIWKKKGRVRSWCTRELLMEYDGVVAWPWGTPGEAPVPRFNQSALVQPNLFLYHRKKTSFFTFDLSWDLE